MVSARSSRHFKKGFLMPIIRTRKTKIVATLGPASNTPDMIEKLLIAGVDIFRLNFSHGTVDDHARRLKIVRDLEKKHGRPVAVLGDLQGPKLRVGKFAEGAIDLTFGQKLRLDLDKTPGDATRVNLPHPEIIAAMEIDGVLLCDDGKVRLKIIGRGPDFLNVEVVAGKKLSNNKGVNVPGVVLPIPALTTKDRADLIAALDMGVDFVALSFVQRPEDVIEARGLIGGRAQICIKIEKPSALQCLDELITLTDTVMLARGDLGVEIPPEDVPSTQKQVIRMARAAGKPIIVATQMLESMIEAPTPTRAEASDVATAVYDGTDAVMLSAETANGSYPFESVSIMDRICTRVEKDIDEHHIATGTQPSMLTERLPQDAITHAAYMVASDIHARAVVCYSHTGTTARFMARHRPWVPILALTPFEDVARRMMMSYATHPAVVKNVETFSEAVDVAVNTAKHQGIAVTGDKLVLTAGVPFGKAGTTNILRVAEV
jgi:pyruvate kinase